MENPQNPYKEVVTVFKKGTRQTKYKRKEFLGKFIHSFQLNKGKESQY